MLEVGAVLELFLGRELKDVLANGELTVDLILRQAEVRDVAIRLSANVFDGYGSSIRKGRFTRNRLCGLRS